MYCDDVDDAEHTPIMCPEWKEDRDEIENKLKLKIVMENFISIMSDNRQNWNIIAGYMEKVIKKKEDKERSTKPLNEE